MCVDQAGHVQIVNHRYIIAAGKTQQKHIFLVFDGPVCVTDHEIEERQLICCLEVQTCRIKAVFRQQLRTQALGQIFEMFREKAVAGETAARVFRICIGDPDEADTQTDISYQVVKAITEIFIADVTFEFIRQSS